MLREVKNARFGRRLTLLGWRYHLIEGERPGSVEWSWRAFRAIEAGQSARAVALFVREPRAYWALEGRIYWEDEQLTADDVLALVRDRERKARRRLERAHAALHGEAPARRREPIPREVRLAVFERDGGCCVECGSRFDVQYDHVIPVSMGGSSTVHNLQILCAPCNRTKGASLG
jgi:5-methylcytosine-specific restriction endonuclease McrA